MHGRNQRFRKWGGRSQVTIDVLRLPHALAQPEVSEGGGRSQVTIDVLRIFHAWAQPEVSEGGAKSSYN